MRTALGDESRRDAQSSESTSAQKGHHHGASTAGEALSEKALASDITAAGRRCGGAVRLQQEHLMRIVAIVVTSSRTLRSVGE